MSTAPDVFVLSCGRMHSPAFVMAKSPLHEVFGTTKITNTVAVATRANGDLALVDAGFSTAACNEPAAVFGRAEAWGYGLRHGSCISIADQLRALGCDPARVKEVVATHLHRDHIHGIVDFPNAELVVSDAEITRYKSSRLGGYNEADIAGHRRSGRIRAIQFARQSFWGFDDSHDLWGDGSVRLLDSAGHTFGALSVALRRHDKWFLHIGDAAYRRWEYRESKRTLLSVFTGTSKQSVARSHARILASEQSEDRPMVVPSHDVEVFRDLPQRPLATF